jgi:hypothetical protein
MNRLLDLWGRWRGEERGRETEERARDGCRQAGWLQGRLVEQMRVFKGEEQQPQHAPAESHTCKVRDVSLSTGTSTVWENRAQGFSDNRMRIATPHASPKNNIQHNSTVLRVATRE